jgi:conjugative transposon TraM protein
MTQQKILSPKILRQRKFFLILPVLILPFITFFLFSVGLVGSAGSQVLSKSNAGFNSNLPDALPSKDSNWNKLQFYEAADKDSAKYRTQQKNDPNFSMRNQSEASLFDTASMGINKGNAQKNYNYDYSNSLQTGKDANEEKVYRKLAQLNEELNKSKSSENMIENKPMNNQNVSGTVDIGDVDKLENMMQTTKGNNDAGDPEMQQINGMLEKILDIQHPDRIESKLKQQSKMNKQSVYPVTLNDNHNAISLLQVKQTDTLKSFLSAQQRNNFYGLNDFIPKENELQNSIAAIIPETQVLITGATVKLRITSEVYINGLLIPKDHLITGIASLEGERLNVNITNILYQNNILPVSLSVYDMDGMQGIYVPGAITNEVAKQSTDQAIQSIGLASLDPSLGAQAASAGIQAAKSLIGKKVKLVKLTVKAGYKVLLHDNNQQINNSN